MFEQIMGRYLHPATPTAATGAPSGDSPARVIADKGYSSRAIRTSLRRRDQPRAAWIEGRWPATA